MSDPLEIEDRGRVRILRLNRPERKNALSSELGWAIVEAVEAASRDDDVWVIGLTGAGDAFCSGLDLAPDSQEGFESAAPLSAQDMAADELGWIGRFPLLFRERCEKLVVGGINGVAVGAGLALAMSTDIRVASDRARFLAGYARLATSPDGGLTWTLAQAVGYERALRFLLLDQSATADEARELGLVGEVVPDDEFAARFAAVCDRLAEVAPLAVRATKRIVHRAATAVELPAHVRWELANARRGLDTEDGREALSAFLEKRKPSFQGR